MTEGRHRMNDDKKQREKEIDKACGNCNMCGRKRLGLYIKEYAICEECTVVMAKVFGDLYYFDDNYDRCKLGEATNPILYRKFADIA